MSRVLVAGLCPLPFENTRRSHGPGIRTWQLAWSLARAGHEVRLLAMITPGAYEGERPLPAEERAGVAIERLTEVALLDPSTIRAAIRAFRPDALVGASLYGSAALAQARPRIPFWADQFGDAMAEAQALASACGTNWPVAHAWRLLGPVLLSADRFSAVTERQRWATIGELGAAGRLTAQTCGHDLVAVIPCAVVPAGESAAPPTSAPAVRGRIVPEDAFLALWSGGVNVWTDVATLVDGLESAMGREDRLHLVTTGGAIAGLDDRVYREMTRRASVSPHARRFHLEGWVHAADVARYVAEANVGVVAELPIYEGLLGSKNRIVQWMGSGLPVVCNRYGELGEELESRRLALTFAPGDAGALADHLLWAAQNAGPLRVLAERASDHAQRDFSFEATTRALVAWAEDPRLAPDAEVRAGTKGPQDHATARQRIAAGLRHLPLARRSPWLARHWRRWWDRSRLR